MPPGGNGTMIRIGLAVQIWASAGVAGHATPSQPITRAASAREQTAVFMVVSRDLALARHSFASFSRSSAVDLEGAGLDPWDQLAPELDRIVERVEPAHQERVHAQRVVLEDRVCDLLRRADK